MSATVTLTWQASNGGKVLTPRSNGKSIGFVLQRTDGSFVWQIDAVRTKYIVKGYGECKSLAAGRNALTRAWRIWCRAHGLVSS